MPKPENPALFGWRVVRDSKTGEVIESEYVTDVTLRDVFAAMAMQGLVNGLVSDIRRATQQVGTPEGMAGIFAAALAGDEKPKIPTFQEVATEKIPASASMAYTMADALLAARERDDG